MTFLASMANVPLAQRRGFGCDSSRRSLASRAQPKGTTVAGHSKQTRLDAPMMHAATGETA